MRTLLRHLALLDIRVHPKSVTRALAVVETWLDACRTRGYVVEAQGEGRPRVQVLGTWFSLRVAERAVLVKQPTPAQVASAKRRHPYATSVQVFEPTGHLHVVLIENTWDIKEWRETSHLGVDGRWRDLFVEMLRHAQYRRTQAAAEDRRRERTALVGRLQGYIDTRVARLTRAAQQYDEFVTLSRCVAALRESAEARTLEPSVRRWLRWATLHVARRNPVDAILRPRLPRDAATEDGDDGDEAWGPDAHD